MEVRDCARMQKGDKDLLKLAQVAEGVASSASDQLDPVILFISSEPGNASVAPIQIQRGLLYVTRGVAH